MWHSCSNHTLAEHFRGRAPALRRLFDEYLAYLRSLGPVTVIPQKTRISLQGRVRFASAVVRKGWIECGLWLKRHVDDPRFARVERYTPVDWVYRFRLRQPADLDEGLKAYLRESYAVGRDAQKAKTRARLLAAAERLFARRGIMATSTAEVAAAARVAHGTLFVHFRGRDALILAVLEEFALRIPARLRELALGAQPSLRDVLHAHVQAIAEQEALYACFIAERQRLPRGSRARLVILQSAVAYYFRDAAQRELQAGRLRRLPLGLLFNSWLGLLHHYVCNRDLFTEGDSALAERGGALIDHFLAMVTVA
jgi:AcrR family transcriptional regulator